MIKCLHNLTLPFHFQTSGHFVDSDLGGDNLNLSQDSLDDNIGVDQVMCHRFIGKGTELCQNVSCSGILSDIFQ